MPAAPSSGAGARWLDETEQAAWQGFLRTQAHLTAQLNRELSASSDLSLQDYAVLAVLSDCPEGRMRAFELGGELGWEKSRLSHHIARMVERDLVSRQKCPSDQRGLYIALTPRGMQALEAAAPAHVQAVRRYFIDLLTPAQLSTLSEIARTVTGAGSEGCQAGPGA